MLNLHKRGRTYHCDGAGRKSRHPHLSEGRGEVFFLDILFHRMSVIEILRQFTPWNLPNLLSFIDLPYLQNSA